MNNVTADAGSGGETFATDDVGGVQYPIGKIAFGADDSATWASSGNGTTDAGTQRVTISSDSTGTVALSATDNAVLDNIDTNTTGLAGTVSGSELQVDVVAALPAGANIIGVVDLGATDNAVLDTIASNTTGLAGTVSGSELQVDIVSGTVTANLSATDNTVLDNIDTNTTGLAGTVSGSELQVDVVAALPAGANTIGVVDLGATDNAVLDNIDTNTAGLAGTVSGSELQVDVVAALPAGTNLVGDVGLSGARTSGGTTIFRSIDLDETEEEVKATPGQVYWMHAMNLSAATLFLKFYNATAATVVVGTTPVVMTFAVATQGDTNGAGFALSVPNGIEFDTAISVAVTTGVADADTGAPGANELLLNLGYA